LVFSLLSVCFILNEERRVKIWFDIVQFIEWKIVFGHYISNIIKQGKLESQNHENTKEVYWEETLAHSAKVSSSM